MLKYVNSLYFSPGFECEHKHRPGPKKRWIGEEKNKQIKKAKIIYIYDI